MKIQYIFSINTGRSGSDYLAKVFGHAVGCRAFHEPDPVGNGEEMRRFALGDPEPMRRLTRKKVEAIREAKGDHPVYAETNHCFIKGFGWFLPEFIPQERIGIVILNREKAKIAESYLRIGCSPLTQRGRDWITTPDAVPPLAPPPRRLMPPRATYRCARVTKLALLKVKSIARKTLRKELPDPRLVVNYELECLQWYVKRTRAQAEIFKRQFPRIRFFEARTEDLNSLELVQDMFAHFGFRAKESLAEVVGKPTNRKPWRWIEGVSK